MDSNSLRERFLSFFEKNGHKILASDSLVPATDPTVLFTSAGMNQFKKQFLGLDISYPRVATCQKCLRTDDLDKVGKTSVHHTFFEMLGNFSFGDYFKKEAITLAWQFLTEDLGIDKDRLWVSVYVEDDESYAIWQKDIGINPGRILKLADKENFWPSEAKIKGPNGPCGPCSEIFFDLGSKVGCAKPDCSPACSCGRFSEVWNLVFTQFERRDDAKLYPLPRKNIDTGMGLERLCAVMQGVPTNFETDLFTSLIKAIAQLIPPSFVIEEKAKQFRLNAIADHLRAICFAIVDGVYPSNEDRGYVVRNLIRRAALFGRELGIEESFIYRLVDPLATVMLKVYPDLRCERENIAQIIQGEEERFIATLDVRIPEFIEALKALSGKGINEVNADMLFKFYDTFGLPWELMESEAAKLNISCNKAKFLQLLEKQRKRSRDKSKLSSSIFVKLYDFKRDDIEFVDSLSLRAKVIALFEQKALITRASAGQIVEIVLDKTPFYAESGGQVGDSGILENEYVKIEILDTKLIESAIIHIGKVLKGDIAVGDEVTASIDSQRRLSITRNHSATHLLQAALRKVLGSHVRQQGSLVTAQYLRFDFTHPKQITDDQLKHIEDIVNDYVHADDVLKKTVVSRQEAKATGALAFFEERYGESVRMVSIGNYSKELCGGSHLESTAQIGFFKIMKESSVASGIRRIQACTAEFAKEFEKELKEQSKRELEKKQKGIKEKELHSQLAADKEKAFREELPSFLKEAKEITTGIRCISIFQKDSDESLLRRMADLVKDKQHNLIVILGSIWEDKGIFVISLTDDLVAKGLSAAGPKGAKGMSILNILADSLKVDYSIKRLAGGGRQSLAQGSCLKENIQRVLDVAPDILKEGLKDLAP
jgi:alanyl-tRNA synthetase